jgi:drug/metabolite transporter (DMT)-like permease
MIALWIPATITAAFLQNLRSAMQKSLKGRLSTAGAAYARFVYAWPFALLYLAALLIGGEGAELPETSRAFWIYCAVGGLAQILFTVVLLWMFSFQSFAVGTTFSKLEVVLIAVLGAALLGDTVGPLGIVAIMLGALGAVVLSMTEGQLSLRAMVRGLGRRVTLIGLLCAALLGMSSVSYRGAALSLDGESVFVSAAFALVVALIMQTVMMGAWFLVFDRAELVCVAREWRRAAPVGLVGMACLVCWFTAFAVQNAPMCGRWGRLNCSLPSLQVC